MFSSCAQRLCRGRYALALSAAALFSLLVPAASLAGENAAAGRFSDGRYETLRAALDDSAADEPLAAPLRLVHGSYEHLLSEVNDLACTFVKRERIDGKLRAYEWGHGKVRLRKLEDGKLVTPLAVYVKFEGPASIKGRELLYVEGENDGRFIATRGGTGSLAGLTKKLELLGDRVREDSLRPVTEFGVEPIAREFLEFGIDELRSGGRPRIKLARDAKINGRPCAFIEVLRRRRVSDVQMARVYIDRGLRVPVRFEEYHWPDQPGADPVLVGEYTYLKVRLNVGLTDRDFDPDNPDYNFWVNSAE